MHTHPRVKVEQPQCARSEHHHAATKCARLKCSRYGPTQRPQLQINSETPPHNSIRDPPPSQLNSRPPKSTQLRVTATCRRPTPHRRIAGTFRPPAKPGVEPGRPLPQHPRVTHHTHAPSPCSHLARHPPHRVHRVLRLTSAPPLLRSSAPLLLRFSSPPFLLSPLTFSCPLPLPLFPSVVMFAGFSPYCYSGGVSFIASERRSSRRRDRERGGIDRATLWRKIWHPSTLSTRRTC